jgi:murein tripeptide amidase MpaA
MNKNTGLYIITLIITFISQGYSRETFLIRFSKPSKTLLLECIAEHRDIAAYNEGNFLDLVVSEYEYSELLLKGYAFEIRSCDQNPGDAVSKEDRERGYKSYDEVVALLRRYESENPELCKVYDIGDSRGKTYVANGISNYSNYNHDIWALKVSDNVETEEDEPGIFYFGAHHARELISVEVPLAILEHIVTGYKTDKNTARTVDNSQIWFVPLVNPDGYRLAVSGSYKKWRKNIRDNNETGMFEDLYDGVDPNRNYEFGWGGAGASPVSSTNLYRGPSPASESEVQAIQTLLGSHHFVAGISYHSYSELVIHPYAYSLDAKAPDYTAINQLAARMAATLPKMDNSGTYEYGPVCQVLYEASGGTEDFAYGKYGIVNVTVELGVSFAPTGDTIQKICDDNIESAMILLERVHKSTLTGHITDSETGKPVEATVYVKEIDDTVTNETSFRYPYKSNKSFGTYYRILVPGLYSVTFSAENYHSKSFTNISITDENITILDVQLDPLSSSLTTPFNLQTNFTASVKKQNKESILITLPCPGNIQNICIYSVIGKLIEKLPVPNQMVQTSSVEWNTTNLPSGIYLITVNAINFKTIKYILSR